MVTSHNAHLQKRVASAFAAALGVRIRERQQELTEAQVSQQQRRQFSNLESWSKHYLPLWFVDPPSDMHRWMFAKCDESTVRRGMLVNLIGPRGGAKSTIGSTALPLRAAVEGTEHNIWLVSETTEQAEKNLEAIKAELVGNDRLARSYPEACGRGPIWRANAIRTRNGVSIEAYSKGQRIRGRKAGPARPSLILADDIQGDSAMTSNDMRSKDWTWFDGSLLKAGDKSTNVFNFATALHRDAIALRLTRTPGWTSQIFPAIRRWPDAMNRWARWSDLFHNLSDPEHESKADAYYRKHKEAMHAGADVLWPEREDLLSLMKQWSINRLTFEREKQGRPVNPDSCEWPEEYFDDEHIWFDDWPERFDCRVMALDPSKGKDARRGDFSAFCLLQVTRGMLYVDLNLARRPTPKMVSDGVDLFLKFRPQAFVVEGVQYQDLLAGVFAEEFRRRGLPEPPIHLLNNTVNKQVRIRTLGPYLSQKRLKFKRGSEGAKETIAQMRDFPDKDQHDDGPDAIEMAIRVADDMLFGRQRNESISGTLV